ncbi:hypothetical protein DEI96_006410 [Curtobacterium sp. MCLR17_031]|uniref:hypothetical protein n=1 Tax=Curtobacterium sp. MCLR17_031 TaxID=2175622 RepID=UPI0011B63A10|nr:hypothetical protein [Curtobacterium sp. MCLR17_031]WIE59247.1 hypothetical protein DEI96_006410 [Curtobacterium sp. MCLR17_031]
MSNESITNNAQKPTGFPPVRRILPVLVTQVLVAMTVAGAFAGLYIGLQKAPTPHHLPVAVVGTQVADAASDALGDRADVRTADTPSDARDLVRSRDAVAALVPGSDGWTLYTAGAEGRSATTAATTMLSGVAAGAGAPVTRTQDVVPLATNDAQGIAGFYLVFGTTLAAFILAQVMNSLGTLARLRTRIIVTVVGSIAAAAVVAVIAGPIDGAVPAATGAVIVVLSLLAVAVSLSTMAITSIVGPMGVIVSTLLFTTLGNATSGATISTHLLPPVLATVGQALPPGAAFGAVTGFSYFDGAGTTGPLLTLGAWIVAAAVALAVAHRVRIGAARRRDVASIAAPVPPAAVVA